MAEKYKTSKTVPKPEDMEEGTVLTGKYTPNSEIAAQMVGMAQVIEEDVREQNPHIKNNEVIIQIVGSVVVTFGQSITGEAKPDESLN